MSKKSSPAECHRSILALFCLLPRHYVHFLLVCQLEILEKATISLQKDQEGQVYNHLTWYNCKSTRKNRKVSHWLYLKLFCAILTESNSLSYSTFSTLPFLCKNPSLIRTKNVLYQCLISYQLVRNLIKCDPVLYVGI